MAFTRSARPVVLDGVGIDLENTSTTQIHTMGTLVQASHNQEYVYVQASGAITQYDYVCIDEDYQAAAGTKTLVDAGHRIGFAQVAFADNDYGFVALRGSDIGVRVAISCAADIRLYTSATAGVLDDASTSQSAVDGVVAVTAVTAATSTEVIATWPLSGVP